MSAAEAGQAAVAGEAAAGQEVAVVEGVVAGAEGKRSALGLLNSIHKEEIA